MIEVATKCFLRGTSCLLRVTSCNKILSRSITKIFTKAHEEQFINRS